MLEPSPLMIEAPKGKIRRSTRPCPFVHGKESSGKRLAALLERSPSTQVDDGAGMAKLVCHRHEIAVAVSQNAPIKPSQVSGYRSRSEARE